MTWQHIHLIRDLELPALQKLVLFALASRADEAGDCWPSIQRLRTDTGLAHRTVQYHLNTLVRRGLVIRDERRGCSALLRLQLCATRGGAPRTGVHDHAQGMQDTAPPLQDVHATPATGASEVKQELPMNPQEDARANTLSTTHAGDVQKHVSKDQNRSAMEPWWHTHAGIDRKGRALGIPPRPGEPYDEYKGRLIELEHTQKRQTTAGGP